MGRITLDKVTKRFGEVEVIPPLDLTIEDPPIEDVIQRVFARETEAPQ